MGGMFLTADDMERLAHLVSDVRHKEAVPIIQFLQQVQQRQGMRRAGPVAQEPGAPPRPELHPYPSDAAHGHFPEAIDRLSAVKN